jgi:ankyrin repeat protein
MNTRHTSAAVPLAAILILGLLSCRIVQPARKAEPGGGTAGIERPEGRSEGLFESAAAGDLARVRDFLERNPNLLNAEDASGWDALSYAAWNARFEVHQYLVVELGAEGNLYTEAALGPWTSFLQRLETNPIGVDARDPKKKAPPLLWAVRTGNQAGCEVLLSRGADILVRDRDGNSALHHAVLMDRLELIEPLLSAGADVEAVDGRGRTPLHLAVQAGSFEACRLLLEAGASVNRGDGVGNTPLHLAAEQGNLELCEYFLFLGALPSLENADGRTPGDLASAQGYERVARLLEAVKS